MTGPKKVSDVVASDSMLRQLMQRAAELRDLEAVLAGRLGDSFARNFNVATLREDGTLVLVAQSPAWATRLRYVVPELLVWARSAPSLSKVVAVQVQIKRSQGPTERV